MNRNSVRFGLTAAAVVVIAVVGYQFLGNSNTGGPGATATPEPTATPTPTPEASVLAVDDLTGTWDYVLDQAQAEIIIDEFAGEVDSADEVAVRLGFDETEWWQGVVFDGELFLADAGPFEIEDDLLVTTGAAGLVRVTFQWEIDGAQLTLIWVEHCRPTLSSLGDRCSDDRVMIEEVDPLMFLAMEHTFTRSSDDPSY